ncbi:MAG TPA: hypothetical protein VLU25_03100 [Acidobacteriota bacterium]|nr:hypothetical protein [Acidobacteriota bacterium]
MWKGIIRVLFWTYERGTLQYDLMVLAILAFIFLTPMGVFDGSIFRDGGQDPAAPVEESAPPSSRSARPEPAEEVPEKPDEDGLGPQRTR